MFSLYLVYLDNKKAPVTKPVLFGL